MNFNWRYTDCEKSFSVSVKKLFVIFIIVIINYHRLIQIFFFIPERNEECVGFTKNAFLSCKKILLLIVIIVQEFHPGTL